jgi:hypothetical protein
VLHAALRFVVAAALLALIATLGTAPLVERLLPFYGWVLGRIDDTFRTVDLSVAQGNGELRISRDATPRSSHVVGKRVVLADPSTLISVSVPAGTALQPLILTISLLIAWPWKQRAELAARFAWAAPLLLLFLALYSLTWYEEVSLLEPGRLSPLVSWGDLMNSGGRLALAAIIAGIAVKLAAPRPNRFIRLPFSGDPIAGCTRSEAGRPTDAVRQTGIGHPQ